MSPDKKNTLAPSFSEAQLLHFSFIFTLFCFMFMLIMRIILIFSPASDLGGGVEQNVIYSIQMLLDNGTLYTNPHFLPFSITQYTPFYYYLCGLTANLTGLDPAQHIRELYIICRTWSLVFNLISALAIYLISRRIFSVNKLVASIISFTSFVFVLLWDIAARPDSLHDAFALWAVYLLLRYLHQSQPAKKNLIILAGAALLSVAAIFSKQSGIQLPIIFLGFFLFTKDWRSAGFVVLVTAVAFGGLLFLYKSLYGEAFLLNVIGGVDNGISLPYFTKYVMGKSLFRLEFIPLALLAAYISIVKMEIIRGTLTERFLCFCTGGMFFFATATALKQGSSIHYYFLFLSLALVLLFKYFVNPPAPSADTLLFKNRRFQSQAPTFIYLVYIQVLLAANLMVQYHNVENFRYGETARIRAKRDVAAGQVASFLKENLPDQTEAYVFANLPIQEKIANRSFIDNILFRYCAIPQLDIFESSTSPSKVLGYSNIEECMRNGKIKFIIEPTSPYEFTILQNFNELKSNNYHLIKTIGPYRILQHERIETTSHQANQKSVKNI